jgi:hypothetical protein
MSNFFMYVPVCERAEMKESEVERVQSVNTLLRIANRSEAVNTLFSSVQVSQNPTPALVLNVLMKIV